MATLDVQLTFKTPLNIGSGAQQGTLASLGMLKDQYGWPYVPASTLKGRWRHAAEQLYGTLMADVEVISPHQTQRQRPDDMVSRLFGTHWGAGLIAFTDLVITAPARAVELRQESERNRFRPVTQERTGIAINQQRRVVEDRFLFTTETLWPGIALTFGGKIQAPITQAEAGLLVASLHLIPNMGRAKSRGLGW
ncbi:MAG: hypothetical protein KDE28_30415, partial [Anaerolineales bacterium]|nr:hypothetical protein [Anaerolineales bacterium]